MKRHFNQAKFWQKLFLLAVIFIAGGGRSFGQPVSLKSQDLELVRLQTKETVYKGKNALYATVIGDNLDTNGIAICKNVILTNGTIELDISGAPSPEADASFRGFIGLAFRVQGGDPPHYECFYLRLTNGRVDDQLRRNHSTQYVSSPDYPWQRLRGETPGMYESYADMAPDEWIHLKITVKDRDARLYLNNAAQPCLVVKDLKNGITAGNLALWVGPGTVCYFSNLKVVKE